MCVCVSSKPAHHYKESSGVGLSADLLFVEQLFLVVLIIAQARELLSSEVKDFLQGLLLGQQLGTAFLP